MTNSSNKLEGGTPAALTTNTEHLQRAWQQNIGQRPLTEFDFTRIKVPAGGATTWTVPTLMGDTQIPVLEGLIVGWREARAFYKTKYGQGPGKRPPDCHSDDALVGIGTPGGPCGNCAMARFGSGENNSQACKNFRLLFMLRGNSMLPEVVVIPPTSVKMHVQFSVKLASVPVPYYGVITRLELVKAKNANGIEFALISFQASRVLDSDEQAKAADIVKVFAPLVQTARAALSNEDVLT